MSDKNSTVPEKGTKQWIKNEKLINQDSALKRARDIQQGIDKPKHRYTSSDGGKGSAQRPGNEQAYKDGWDRIWGNKND